MSSALLIVLTLISGALWSQKAAVKRAERNLKHFDYARAAENYKQAISKAPTDLTLKEKLARVYVVMGNHVEAEAIYAQIVKEPISQSIDKLYYGMELRANGKYELAGVQFKAYARAEPRDPRGKELSDGVDKMKTLVADSNSKMYDIFNLAMVNSPASEIGVATYKQGIMFSSNRGRRSSAVPYTDINTGHDYYQLYSAAPQGDDVAAPVKLKGKINSKFNIGPAVISADGKEMYFTSNNMKKGHAKKSKDKAVKLKIMHADWEDSKQQWTNIKEIGIDNDQYSVGHPALSKDGKALYFMSDMPGSLGETDIYVTYKDKSGNWGPAINLGKEVNTQGREMFPFIADDGKLYFSSDCRTGIGGLDIYSATFKNGEWGNVKNLGGKVNTKDDDFGYIIDAKNTWGYFISNRPGGKGEDDIYKFKKKGITLMGTVADARTNAVLPGAQVKLMDGDKVVTVKTTGEKGDFSFTVLQEKDYKIVTEKDDYESNNTAIAGSETNQSVMVMLTHKAVDLSVYVKETGVGTILPGSTVELTNTASGEKKTLQTKNDGRCDFELAPNTDYTLCAFKKTDNPKSAYSHKCKDISTKGISSNNLMESVELTYLEESKVIKSENIYYDFDKAEIRPDAAMELDKLVDIMKQFPGMELELSSYTDCRGSLKWNDILSTKRAKSCADYLISHGIDKKRLLAVGYGSRKPVNNCDCLDRSHSNCSEELQMQNRRTEFKILKLQ